MKLLRTLGEAAHLGILVRAMHINTQKQSWHRMDSMQFGTLLSAAMQNMSSLKVLTLESSTEGMLIPAGTLDMDTGVSFQLEKLHWHVPFFDPSIKKVLEQQRHSLRYLNFSVVDLDTAPLSPISFPVLEILIGQLMVVESFLSGSKVTHLTLIIEQDDVLFFEDDQLVRLSEVELQKRLQALELGFNFVKTLILQERQTGLRPKMKIFRRLLNNIETLHLSGSNTLVVFHNLWMKASKCLPINFDHPQELRDLSAYPTLQRVVLSTAYAGEPSALYPREGHTEITTELFDKCPRLVLIDIKHRLNRNLCQAVYRRWKRGDREYIEVAEEDVMKDI
ncbi:hypothetical protein CVT26_001060 [Gymnopilus dilepis]|uniref:Uncharacterized protein n=1 Tax=Gymnopilus dilepis TaxID=231916 RepID=A0A409WL85_9AGAR|nr:hypothetical protein CVT26_001060 [Gymnopilus dilepis]